MTILLPGQAEPQCCQQSMSAVGKRESKGVRFAENSLFYLIPINVTFMRFVCENAHFLQASIWVLFETSLDITLNGINGITHNIRGNGFLLTGARIHM